MRRRRRSGAEDKLLSYKEYVINGLFNMKPNTRLLEKLKSQQTTENTLDSGEISIYSFANQDRNFRVPVHDEKYREMIEYRGNWSKYFENNNPIYLEVGSGRCKFIIESAKTNPNINYIALEVKEEVLLRGAQKADELELDNVTFLWGNVEFLDFYFADKELSRIFINFCDPWPKKRNAKRRLTSQFFLNLYKKKMNNKGEIHFKTDNKSLFEFSLNEFSDSSWKLKNISLDLANSDFIDNIRTEYEEKFMDLGMPIYRLEATYIGYEE